MKRIILAVAAATAAALIAGIPVTAYSSVEDNADYSRCFWVSEYWVAYPISDGHRDYHEEKGDSDGVAQCITWNHIHDICQAETERMIEFSKQKYGEKSGRVVIEFRKRTGWKTYSEWKKRSILLKNIFRNAKEI